MEITHTQEIQMRKNHYYTIIITAVAILGTSMLAGCADNKQVDPRSGFQMPRLSMNYGWMT